jgi:hypothetical protein
MWAVDDTQVFGWDRGRPARNEREARKQTKKMAVKRTTLLWRVAGGTPAVPVNHLNDQVGRLISI